MIPFLIGRKNFPWSLMFDSVSGSVWSSTLSDPPPNAGQIHPGPVNCSVLQSQPPPHRHVVKVFCRGIGVGIRHTLEHVGARRDATPGSAVTVSRRSQPLCDSWAALSDEVARWVSELTEEEGCEPSGPPSRLFRLVTKKNKTSRTRRVKASVILCRSVKVGRFLM